MARMRILLAASDRDLLECYQKILEADCGETVTAFDGTRVLTALAEERFDLVILDRQLPRVEHTKIVQRLRDGNIPVIVLSDEPDEAKKRGAAPRADAYLTHPFRPETLTGLIRAHTEKRKDSNGDGA